MMCKQVNISGDIPESVYDHIWNALETAFYGDVYLLSCDGIDKHTKLSTPILAATIHGDKEESKYFKNFLIRYVKDDKEEIKLHKIDITLLKPMRDKYKANYDNWKTNKVN